MPLWRFLIALLLIAGVSAQAFELIMPLGDDGNPRSLNEIREKLQNGAHLSARQLFYDEVVKKLPDPDAESILSIALERYLYSEEAFLYGDAYRAMLSHVGERDLPLILERPLVAAQVLQELNINTRFAKYLAVEMASDPIFSQWLRKARTDPKKVGAIRKQLLTRDKLWIRMIESKSPRELTDLAILDGRFPIFDLPNVRNRAFQAMHDGPPSREMEQIARQLRRHARSDPQMIEKWLSLDRRYVEILLADRSFYENAALSPEMRTASFLRALDLGVVSPEQWARQVRHIRENRPTADTMERLRSSLADPQIAQKALEVWPELALPGRGRGKNSVDLAATRYQRDPSPTNRSVLLVTASQDPQRAARHKEQLIPIAAETLGDLATNRDDFRGALARADLAKNSIKYIHPLPEEIQSGLIDLTRAAHPHATDQGFEALDLLLKQAPLSPVILRKLLDPEAHSPFNPYSVHLSSKAPPPKYIQDTPVVTTADVFGLKKQRDLKKEWLKWIDFLAQNRSEPLAQKEIGRFLKGTNFGPEFDEWRSLLIQKLRKMTPVGEELQSALSEIMTAPETLASFARTAPELLSEARPLTEAHAAAVRELLRPHAELGKPRAVRIKTLEAVISKYWGSALLPFADMTQILGERCLPHVDGLLNHKASND